jgi:hypothetical protein
MDILLWFLCGVALLLAAAFAFAELATMERALPSLLSYLSTHSTRKSPKALSQLGYKLQYKEQRRSGGDLVVELPYLSL